MLNLFQQFTKNTFHILFIYNYLRTFVPDGTSLTKRCAIYCLTNKEKTSIKVALYVNIRYLCRRKEYYYGKENKRY